MTKKSSCRIGTSGWHYDHWKGPFYPEDLPDKELLQFYCDRFDTVEINNSFYNLPSKKTFNQWRQIVDKDFLFSVKASRYITHMKKLKDPEKAVVKFFNAVQSLKDKLGPVLFQLPPRWHMNIERLDAFLAQLPQKHRYTFEFRDKSWFEEETYNVLSNHNAAFCIYDLNGQVSPEIVTADFVYVRLHGPEQTAYTGSYTKRRLNAWTKKFKNWMKEGKDIYCYFDNDQNGFAAKNAKTLQEIMHS